MDTNVVVDIVRDREPVRTHFRHAVSSDAVLVISTFVLQELIFGAEASGRPERERAKLAPILRNVEVLPFEASDAETGGRAQAAMKAVGRRAPPGDFIVGAHALARGCRLVTANTRHFEHIPGLELLNWRLPPEAKQDPIHA